MEEIIKRINEAYDVLSDDEKREKYDKTIASNYISQEDFKKLYNENQQLKQQLNNTYSYINQNYKKTINNNDFNYNQNANTNINSSYEQRVNETINQAYKKAYHDAYIQDLKNRGYKIKYKKTFKDIIKDIVSFIITFIIIYSFLNIPFIKNYIIYSFSPLLKIIK